MDSYEYNINLFREFLAYPDKQDLILYKDKKRLELLELKVMYWINYKGVDFILKEYQKITKNWWSGTKEQAKNNLMRILRIMGVEL